MIPSDEDLGLIKGAHQVSEPTKESLEQADRILDLQSTSTPLRKLMAIKFDAVRREERAKAEKLAEALRNATQYTYHRAICSTRLFPPDPCNCGFNKMLDFAEAALAAWERANHG